MWARAPNNFRFTAPFTGDSGGKRFAAVVTLRAILDDKEWLEEQFWSKDIFRRDTRFHNGLGLALVDRYLCARAMYFFGTKASKVTNEILDIRKVEGYENPNGVGSTL